MDLLTAGIATKAIEAIKPALLAAGGQVASDALAKAGQGVSAVYAWLKSKLTKPAAAVALQQAAAAPRDDDAWADLRALLQSLLERDATLREELDALLATLPAADTTTQTLHQSGNNNIAAQVKGNSNTTNINRP